MSADEKFTNAFARFLLENGRDFRLYSEEWELARDAFKAGWNGAVDEAAAIVEKAL